MRRGIMIILIVIGAAGLGRYSLRVRNVDAIALFASGLLAGIGFAGALRRSGK